MNAKGLPVPSVWPAFPEDATFTSALTAGRRYAGMTNVQFTMKYFGVEGFSGDIFAFNARLFAGGVLGGAGQLSNVVHRLTPFKFFASFATEADESAWLSAITAGDVVAGRRFMPPPVVSRFVARQYRMCRECVGDDEHRFGVGHWHVVHQLPAISRCPWHGGDLHDRCKDCGKHLGDRRSLSRLPGDPCGRCQSTKTAGPPLHPRCTGYDSLEELTMRALVGRAPELRPENRMRLLDLVIFRRIGEHGLQEALSRFLAFWSVNNAAQLASILGCSVCEQRLLRLFRGVDTGAARQLQTAVVAFALQHATTTDIASCTESESTPGAAENLFDAPYSDKVDFVLLRKFCESAIQIGYPIVAARYLAAGASHRVISHRRMADSSVTKRFIGTFPDEIRARYEALVPARTQRPSLTSESDRNSARNRIEYALRNECKTRMQLSKFDHYAYLWCLQHDAAWLDRVFPRRANSEDWRSSDVEAASIRKILIGAIRAGASTRTNLRNARNRAFRWALKNDPAWLDSVMPSCRGFKTLTPRPIVEVG